MAAPGCLHPEEAAHNTILLISHVAAGEAPADARHGHGGVDGEDATTTLHSDGGVDDEYATTTATCQGHGVDNDDYAAVFGFTALSRLLEKRKECIYIKILPDTSGFSYTHGHRSAIRMHLTRRLSSPRPSASGSQV